MSEVIRHTPVEGNPNLQDMFTRFQWRQEDVEGQDYKNKVEFTFAATPLINMMSDFHIGHPTTDYHRIEDEMNAILGTANSFVVMLGDEIDNMNWNPGQFEQMEQTPEQILFYWAIVRELAKSDRLLLRLPGDHDGWLKKAGFDLNMMARNEGVNTTSGPTHMVANVGKEQYVGFLSHKLPGHSMYNSNHPQMRSERFGAGRGSDWIASGHNHQKQIAEGFTHTRGGETMAVTYHALGSYKPTDGWLQKQGYPAQNRTPEEMYGTTIMLDGKKHIIYSSNDIVDANHSMRGVGKKIKHALVSRLTALHTGFDAEKAEALWREQDGEYPSENSGR